jgi:hypothetical protein
MNVPNWESLSWVDRRAHLRGAFRLGKITSSTRKDLEEYLVVLANTTEGGKMDPREETERFATVVRHLLQVRVSEELHERSRRLSFWALGISGAALLASAWQAWGAWLVGMWQAWGVHR